MHLTALALQLSSADNAARQQLIAFPDGTIFRRSVTSESRTRWRGGNVSDLPTWTQGYCDLAAASPTPMNVSHGPFVMEVTEDENDSASKGTLARNVQLRFQRVLDAIDEGTDK
jgi:hypothetical protein